MPSDKIGAENHRDRVIGRTHAFILSDHHDWDRQGLNDRGDSFFNHVNLQGYGLSGVIRDNSARTFMRIAVNFQRNNYFRSSNTMLINSGGSKRCAMQVSKLSISQLRSENSPYSYTLIIGDLCRWRAEGRNVSPFDTVTFLAFDELTAESLANMDVAMVFSTLVADTFDAVDIAVRLVELDYRGPYRALTTLLQDTDVIKDEVKLVAPLLDFDILALR